LKLWEVFIGFEKENLYCRKLPLLGGANLGKYNAIGNWGGLLSNEQNAQVSDTTDDDTCPGHPGVVMQMTKYIFANF
jgi:hypothetical protein